VGGSRGRHEVAAGVQAAADAGEEAVELGEPLRSGEIRRVGADDRKGERLSCADLACKCRTGRLCSLCDP
jgi:hypothetical protein